VNTYEVVFLHSTGKAREDPAYVDAKAEHLAYVEKQRRAGYVRLYGAVGGAPREQVNSVFLYRVGSLEQARRIAEADPLVEQGWITVSVGEFVTGWKG
jgi:uncharacterized protein YciI